ncbi:hypothetical protein M0R45_001826 [Rubus argutus]|uniref:Uncharacterized protein n=1 Tax=Rubus argutus TaxID=59490 RepID=A0AAW1VEQ7_RUBAR
MSALVDIWSNEAKKRSQSDQTLSSNASASSTDARSSQGNGGMSSSTLLAPVFGRVKCQLAFDTLFV